MNGGYIYIKARLDVKDLEKDIEKAYRDLEKLQKQNQNLEKEKAKIQVEIDENAFTKAKKRLAEIDEERRKVFEQIHAEGGRTYETRVKLRDLQDEEKAVTLGISEKDAIKLDQSKAKLQEINQLIESNNNKQNNLNSTIEKTNQKLDQTKKQMSLKNIAGSIQQNVSDIGNKMDNIIKKVGRWAIALIGVRSMYSFIRNSANIVSGYDDEVRTDIAYISFLLGSTLEPVIKRIIEFAYGLLKIIRMIIYALFHVDIFANATMDKFKKSQGYLKGANKQANELRKTLAGFDEMNILGDNTSLDSASGGGGGFTLPTDPLEDWGEITIPSWMQWILNNGEEVARILGAIAGALAMFKIGSALGGTTGGVVGLVSFIYFYEYFKLIEETIDSIVAYFDNPSWETFFGMIDKATTGTLFNFVLNLEWVKKGLEGIYNFIQENELTKAIWDWLVKPFEKFFASKSDTETRFQGFGEIIARWILGGFVGGFAGAVWDSIVHCVSMLIDDFWKSLGFGQKKGASKGASAKSGAGGSGGTSPEFESMGASISNSIASGISIQTIINRFLSLPSGLNAIFVTIPTKFKEALNKLGPWIKETLIPSLKEKFGQLGTSVGNIVGTKFKEVINNIIGAIETKINSAINNINFLIRGLKALASTLGLGKNINEIGQLKLPRLAKGGIINMPNKGVMVGSAIAGERGAEGVIPLTDAQQMALLGEAIGRYITINANITNNMNGRVISRELQRINNENDFAFNR